LTLDLRLGSRLALVVGLWSGIAGASPHDGDPATRACLDAYVRGQQERAEGKIVEARDDFVRCAQPGCPDVATRDCSRWKEEADARVPTVVFELRDEHGQLRIDGSVSLDGQPLPAALEGRALPVDPGKHVFRFELPGEKPSDQEAVVLEGVKAQIVRGGSPAARSAQASSTPWGEATRAARPVPALVWVTGAASLLGMASFAYFGATGLSDENTLRARCAVSCTQADADSGRASIRIKYAVADVSVGFSALAAGVAAWVFFTRPTVSVDVGMTHGGALATWTAGF
jgi:hypothetical protein